MKKNLKDFSLGIVIILTGVIIVNPVDYEKISLFSRVLGVISIFLGYLILLAGIILLPPLFRRFWKWYSYVPHPFNEREWKRLCEINALEQGITSPYLPLRWYETLEDPLYYPYQSSELSKTNQLVKSIEHLWFSERDVEYDRQGNLRKSPWIATKKKYWKNREKT